MKEIRKVCIFLFIMIVLFGVSTRVNAVNVEQNVEQFDSENEVIFKELTCTYANGTGFVQNSDGTFDWYSKENDEWKSVSGKTGIKISGNDNYTKSEDGKTTYDNGKIKVNFYTGYFSYGTFTLADCPAYSFYDGTYSYSDNQGLGYKELTTNDYIYPDVSVKELTCLYKADEETEKYDYVLLTQGENGSNDVKVYYASGNQDVRLMSNWTENTKGNVYFLNNSGSNDYLIEDLRGIGDGVSLENVRLDSCPGGFLSMGDYDMAFNGSATGAYTEIVDSYDYVTLNVVEVGSVDVNVDNIGKTCQDIGTDFWLSDLDTRKYTGSCLYMKDVSSSSTDGVTSSGCHIVQVDFGSRYLKITEYDYKKKEYSSLAEYSYTNYNEEHSGSFKIHDNFSASYIATQVGGACLDVILVDRYYYHFRPQGNNSQPDEDINTMVYVSGTKGDSYFISNVRGNNSVTGKALTLDGSWGGNFNIIDIKNCEELLGEDLAGKLKVAWNLIRIAVPIILIVFGVIDFVKAIFAGNEDTMKKSQKKFITRVIIAVIIFLVPFVLSLLLQIANGIWGNIGTDICGILG